MPTAQEIVDLIDQAHLNLHDAEHVLAQGGTAAAHRTAAIAATKAWFCAAELAKHLGDDTGPASNVIARVHDRAEEILAMVTPQPHGARRALMLMAMRAGLPLPQPPQREPPPWLVKARDEAMAASVSWAEVGADEQAEVLNGMERDAVVFGHMVPASGQARAAALSLLLSLSKWLVPGAPESVNVPAGK